MIHKHHFVLAWKRNNIPFWRCIDCDTQFGVNAIAYRLNKYEQLKAEVERLRGWRETVNAGHPIDRWDNIVDCYLSDRRRAQTLTDQGKGLSGANEAFVVCWDLLADIYDALQESE